MGVEGESEAAMPDRHDIAVQRNGFNAQEAAFRLGIKVDAAVVYDFVSYWSVADRAVLIQADLSGHVRNEVVAHSVAHIEMAESPELAAALDGERWRGRIEMQVHDVVAHRLIPVQNLRDALEIGSNLPDVAAILGVTEFLLGWRLQHLKNEEFAVIPVHLLNRLGWLPGMATEYPYRCLWPTGSSGEMLRQMAPGRHR
ncbi:ImmA/IrrE family metallo-endopeptidase [Nocardia halotolerans]|uniref:ImmA/IrrE family metallo-endopeptidase n=1 Tax=Nocardia halotolerans TaxID=1755878 RepID=A0ABV8VF15_9NOCA